MYRYLPIRKVHGREILDSRGNPTLEVEVTVGEGILGKDCFTGKAMVPSGASTGTHEAVELRDRELRYRGLDVQKAVEHVNVQIADQITGENALNQTEIDKMLLREDGTENKSRLGANAILGVSIATAKAAALALGVPLYQYLGGIGKKNLPIPMMNILNGGVHSDNCVDFQEFMIMPVKKTGFPERLEMCCSVYHTLKNILKEKGLSTGVGDEGGFAPDLPDALHVLDVIQEAVLKAGYQPGSDIMIALDVAASELYDHASGKYYFSGESRQKGKEIFRTTEEMIQYYEKLVEAFPIISIEDGLDEDDWEGWKNLTRELGTRVQLVGDDLFVTNKKRLERGKELSCGNAILIKVNQIGTLTETLETIEKAQRSGYRTIISHRSGETEDSFIADLSVAVNAGQIKTGAPCRSERISKYNELLRIYENIHKKMI